MWHRASGSCFLVFWYTLDMRITTSDVFFLDDISRNSDHQDDPRFGQGPYKLPIHPHFSLFPRHPSLFVCFPPEIFQPTPDWGRHRAVGYPAGKLRSNLQIVTTVEYLYLSITFYNLDMLCIYIYISRWCSLIYIFHSKNPNNLFSFHWIHLHFQVFVLDEADELMSRGFKDQTKNGQVVCYWVVAIQMAVSKNRDIPKMDGL